MTHAAGIKKIVVIGPESTGKSTLCEKLAHHYGTRWVPEYAREYLEKHGPKYAYEDLRVIAAGQIQAEEKALEKQGTGPSRPQYLFIDTDMYVMKVWSEFVFNRCDNWILNRIAERKYDGYLLCDVDLPWVRDDLREYPDLAVRQKLFYFYKDLLVNQATPWCTVSGTYDERFARAVDCVDKLFT